MRKKKENIKNNPQVFERDTIEIELPIVHVSKRYVEDLGIKGASDKIYDYLYKKVIKKELKKLIK